MLMLPEHSITSTNVIHQGDALAVLRRLPSEFVDCVVTSPPYNLKWANTNNHGMHQNAKWIDDFRFGYDIYNDSRPEPEYQIWLQAIVRECLRISKGLVWINHKTRFRDGVAIHPLSFLPFPMWSEVVWNRGGSMTLNSRRFAPSHEYVFGFGRPHYWNDKFNTHMTVWRINFEQGNDHPAPFPEALIEPLIMASCPDDGIVFDPFMGSGTTAVVAQKNGRRYIGAEISPKYVEMARARLIQLYTLPMFTESA